MSRAQPIGLIANPRSGSDVRRAISAAGSSTLDEKVSIIRRVVLSALKLGADTFYVHRDPHALIRRATETIKAANIIEVDIELTFSEQDSVAAATAMREAGCGVVCVLGGDGTNRAVAKGWSDVPVIPVSTGTNNAFPVFVEPTVAGAAAGLLAAGHVALDEVCRPAKVVRVEGVQPDVALIDAVVVDDPYVGSLALFDPNTIELAVLARADPAAIGFAGVGGLLDPVTADDDRGLLIRFEPPAGAASILCAPTAPGHYAELGIVEVRPLELCEPVLVDGPRLLAFDGERKRRLLPDETVTMSVRRDGPRVVDVAATMHLAAERGIFSTVR